MNSDSQTIDRGNFLKKAQGAFLGAAVGDALGWPQEDRSNRAGKRFGSSGGSPNRGFQQWVKRSGGRFYRHEEVILPGEYSDDTQLLLCTARSLFYGEDWWDFLTTRELPAWTLYERGGGQATKRAARAWLASRPPWAAVEDQERQAYFDAGGNGVAMRIMPHCLFRVAESSFGPIAKDIVANGVCTHGHPRALIGSLAFGFAIWQVFQATGTIPYGAIIQEVLNEEKQWSALPDLSDSCPTWKNAAEATTSGRYHLDWQQAVNEMLDLLDRCNYAMGRGALAVDQETLSQLGCFHPVMKGAGTVAAAGSIFLASRYAADPLHGLIEAAFAHGADTDTLASMTSCILGAMAGSEWLGDRAGQIQDASYIKSFGEFLARGNWVRQGRLADTASRSLKKGSDAFFTMLQNARDGDTVLLPDERDAEVSPPQLLKSLTSSSQVLSWKLTTSDGQTLYVKRISRRTETEDRGQGSLFDPPVIAGPETYEPCNVSKVVLKLLVKDLAKARTFYEKALGLNVTKESKSLVNLGGIIALVQVDYDRNLTDEGHTAVMRRGLTVNVLTHSFDATFENVRRFGAQILGPVSEVQGQRFFKCLDPERNIVEVFEVPQGASQSGQVQMIDGAPR